MLKSILKLQTRYPGRVLRLANEDAAAAESAAQAATAAAQETALANAMAGMKIVDAQGRVLPIAGRQGSQITLGNASAALAAEPIQRLTTFAVGYPTDNVEEVAQFLAPYVPAPIKFDYQVNPKANAYIAQEDDGIGVNGLPGVILPDPKTTASGTLQWRGLETQMTENERLLADAIPGGSATMEEEDRIQMLLDATRRGRALRIIAAAAAAAGGATGKRWGAADNPVTDLRAAVSAIAQLVGGFQNVCLLFGSGAWEILIDQVRMAGGGNYPYQVVDEARVASLLGIPAANVKKSYFQVLSSKQGKTAALTGLLTAAEVYIFGRTPTPSRRDASFMKTFAMQQAGGWYQVYSYQPHPKVTRYGLDYHELVVVTNSSAVARFTITTT